VREAPEEKAVAIQLLALGPLSSFRSPHIGLDKIIYRDDDDDDDDDGLVVMMMD